MLVLAGSVFTELDQAIYDLHLVPLDSPLRLPVQLVVFLGQRAPATLLAGAVALWCALRVRSLQPLVTYVLALVGFVGSVLVLKWATGRTGPRYTDEAHTVWVGGNIFPSGHVTGAVVMYGLIALVAPLAYRKVLTVAAAVIAVVVGMGTTALNLHWFSDVVGGWLDGSLVLLFAWALTPAVHERLSAVWQRFRAWWVAASQASEPAAFDTAALPFDTTALRRAGEPTESAVTRRS